MSANTYNNLSFARVWRRILLLIFLLAASVSVVDYAWRWHQSDRSNLAPEWQALFSLAARLYQQEPHILERSIKLSDGQTLAIQIDKAENIQLDQTGVIDQEIKQLSLDIQTIVIQSEIYYYQYLPSNNIHIRIGPVKQASTGYWYSVGFYLALAGIIWLWFRPILSGLDRLRTAMRNFSLDPKSNPKLGRHPEPVSSMVTSFLAMRSKIHTLVDVQQSLTRGLSHEIRTPLARIKFSLAALKGEDHKNIQSISQDLDEIEALTSAMLDYSRLHQLEQINIAERFNIRDMLLSFSEQNSHNSNDMRDVKLHIELSPDAKAINANENLLKIAISNLVENAKRYAKSEITLTFTEEEREMKLSVSDDGPGINKQNLEQLVLPFARGSNDSAVTHAGFGLGLSTVKKIMELHGGRLVLSASSSGGLLAELVWPKSET